MRIVSQNKWNDLTYDGSNLSIRQDKQYEKYGTIEFQIVAYDLRGQFLTLAEYITEERALEVMEEINAQWKNNEILEKFADCGLGNDLRAVLDEWKSTLIFHMPKEKRR